MDEKKQIKGIIADALNSDHVTYEDAKNLFSVLQGAVQDAKTTLESLVSQNKEETMGECEKMRKDIASFEKGVDKIVKTLTAKNDKTIDERITKAVNDVLKLIPTIPDPIIFDPTSLQNQIDVLMAFESPKIEAQEVRDLLEVLQGEERLDASAIKNLPENTRTIVEGMNKVLALYMLLDVDVSGIAIGQSIKWDGIRWIPYTPAGGTATAVYNEVASGSGTTFTLAHTPTSGAIVRVYANGQKLFPTTDYSISSATITTVSTWAASALNVDYEY